MSSHNRVAASVRESKEKNPELFCVVKACLWRIKTPRGDSPCRNHPVQPTPAEPIDPASKGQACNRCDRLVGMRVEVRMSSQRLVVCAACAVLMATTEATARIVAFTPLACSPWVASDGTYWADTSDCRVHQRAIDAEAVRFAERVNGVVERRAMQQERTVAEVRASLLSRMSAQQRATLQRRGISA